MHKPSLFSIPINIKQSVLFALFQTGHVYRTACYMLWHAMVYTWTSWAPGLRCILLPCHLANFYALTASPPASWAHLSHGRYHITLTLEGAGGLAEPVSHSSQFPSSRHTHVIPDLTTDLCSCFFSFSLGVFFSQVSPPTMLPQPCCILWLMSDILSIIQEIDMCSSFIKPHLALSFHLILLQIVGGKQPGKSPHPRLSTHVYGMNIINFISMTLQIL